ncbi:hypothetical protein AB4212_61450, partial [Streptomyces sp. 2MCAF27]
ATPARPVEVDQEEIVRARQDYEDALNSFTSAATDVDTIGERLDTGVGTSSDAAAHQDAGHRAEQARGRMLDAAARLRGLDIDPHGDPYTPGQEGTEGGEGDARSRQGQVPDVHRDDAQRKWIAQQVIPEDLPENPPLLDPDDHVATAELNDAGVKPGSRQQTAEALGMDRFPVRDLHLDLAPVDHVKLQMVRPGPWPATLDATAANATRRIWQSAYADFAGAVPDDGP